MYLSPVKVRKVQKQIALYSATQKRNGKIYLVSVQWPYHTNQTNIYICLLNTKKQFSLLLNFSDLYSKVYRLNVCIDFFDRQTSFPVPFSFLHAFWDLLIFPIIKFIEFCCQQRGKRDEPEVKHLTFAQLNARRKHAKLMQELISRLINKNKKTKKRAIKTKSIKQHESRC